jgi:thiol-disulfide isomerase/thioredoxin
MIVGRVGIGLVLLGLAIAPPVAPSAAAQAALSSSPSPSPTPIPGPVVGDVIPPFDAEGMAGSPVHVDFPKGSKTVMIFFLSGCPHCHKMMPEWNRAYQHRPPSLKVLGVLMDKEPPGFFQVMPVSFPVVRAPSSAFLHILKIRTAPVTMRVETGGKVIDVGLGELDGIRLGQLFAP